ncbi:hypothetical protein GCM10009123_11290 [Kangiella japonica]|uniref:Sel1 repeat family protein n=1 Tax=Kangiella japonica TaxID=647384 RepID=A0ABN0SY60_9GAMM
MSIKKVLIIVSLILFPTITSAKETLFDLHRVEEGAEKKADEYFEQGNYQAAFEQYLSLAKYGDKYSQYMVSFHYLNGLGVKKDILQAYGWAGLARRSPSLEIKRFYQQVQEAVPDAEKHQAEKVKIDLSEQYSDLAIAMNLKKMIRNTIPECTGSRIRGNCGFIQHYCVDSGNQKSLDECLRKVSLTNPNVIRALKQDLARTNRFIEQKLATGGSVISTEVESPEQEQPETEEK